MPVGKVGQVGCKGLQADVPVTLSSSVLGDLSQDRADGDDINKRMVYVHKVVRRAENKQASGPSASLLASRRWKLTQTARHVSANCSGRAQLIGLTHGDQPPESRQPTFSGVCEHWAVKTTAARLGGLPLPGRWAIIGAAIAGMIGAVVGLVIGLIVHAPTAPFAVIEVGIPAAIVGGVIGLNTGVVVMASRRIRQSRRWHRR